MFVARAEGGQVHGLGIGHKDHAVRVAHAHGHRIAGQGQVQRVDGMGQRHLIPVQLRRAHVDRHQAIRPAHGMQRAAHGGQADRVATRLAITKSDTQRVALPQASALVPSLFQKSSAKSA